MARVRKGAALL
jgi:hypothetical protein